MRHELTALATLDGRCDRNFDAELIRLMGFAFADALNLGRVQAENFLATLAGALRVDALSQCQFWSEERGQIGIVFDLAADIAQHPAELRS